MRNLESLPLSQILNQSLDFLSCIFKNSGQCSLVRSGKKGHSHLRRTGLLSEAFSILKPWDGSSLTRESQQATAERKAGCRVRKATSFSGGDARNWEVVGCLVS